MKPDEAAIKWNTRYKNECQYFDTPVRKLLQSHKSHLPSSGTALEIAGGTGISSNYLQKSGLQVIEIDISFQALRIARTLNQDVFHVAADANQLPLMNINFDVICNFYFFEKKLTPTIKQLLKPGGIVFFETLTTHMLSIRPEIPVEYLLAPGELKEHFQDFDIIYYFEGWTTSDHGKRKSIGSLVAIKP